MGSDEIRSRFLKFFEARGHKIIPSSSLVPENDPSVLFTTAGMQQFKLYYINPKDAEKNFRSLNTVTVQKCIRTGDIDEVGDAAHLTFFEMLGNFSFGKYWKKEAIEYAYDFITKELGLTIDYISVFEGDAETPADDESREIWQKINPKLKIKNHNRADNFWGPTGEEGPCGPTTEIYVNGVEIWNIVFNEFYKTKEGKYNSLEVRGIDTGMGLERLLVQVQKKNNVYETDLFESIVESIKKNSENYDERSARIIADHFRAAIFIASDGVIPSNTGRGYILRRLLRKVFTKASKIGLPDNSLLDLIPLIYEIYKKTYPEIKEKYDDHISVVKNEGKLFEKPLNGIEIYRLDLEAAKLGIIKKMRDLPILEDRDTASGFYIHHLFKTFGIPIDLMVDIAKKTGFNVDEEKINKTLREHQELSRTASAGMFKGGLANHNEKTIKLHTAHHLLLAALKAVIGSGVKQRGSNINEERLRIDFLCDHKLTDEEKKKVEDFVNEKIKLGLDVIRREMPLSEAQKIGAEMEFGAKYPDIVSVYFIEEPAEKGSSKNSNVISKEFCGGPHVKNTGELGQFKIQKEEAVAQGIRRIKAILTN